MAWPDIEAFVAVAREGQLARAAALLGTSVPTLHRRIAALESALGTPLFVRGNAGHRLTEAGQRLVRAAGEAEAAVGAFRRAAASVRVVPEGLVRIAAPDTIVSDFLAPAVAALRAAAPLVVPEFVTSPLRLRLDERQADMAIRLAEPGEASLVARRIGTVRFALQAPVEAEAVHAAVRDEDGFLRVPWVGWTHRYEHLPTARASAGLLPAAEKRAGANVMLQHVALAKALGAAVVLPDYMARRAGGLARVMAAPFPLLELPLWLVVNPEMRGTPALRAVERWLEAALAELREGKEEPLF